MSVYTRWYKEGTIAVTSGSPNVTGTNTYWGTAGLNPGDIVKIGGVDYELLSVVDNTHLTLANNFTGATASGLAYSIVRNFTATSSAKVAAQAAGLMGDFERYIDTDMQKINGKSAYEVAVANGYTGTAAQWLETLKAGGEWTAANTRISSLETRTSILTNGNSHKFLFRGRNLGSVITDAQWQAISSGSFDDLFIGDYWVINGKTYIIVDINYYLGFSTCSNKNHLVLMVLAGSAAYTADGDGSTGYYGSDIRNTFIPQFTEDYIIPAFGSSHLYKHLDYICNAFDIDTVKHTGYVEVYDSCVELPSWQMIMTRERVHHHNDDFVKAGVHMCNALCHDIFAYFRFRNNVMNNGWMRELTKFRGYSGWNFWSSSCLMGVPPISQEHDVWLYFTVC